MPPVRVRDELYWLVDDCGTHKHTHTGQTQPLMPPVRVRDELYWLVDDCGTHKHTHTGQTQPLMPPVRVRDSCTGWWTTAGHTNTHTQVRHSR